MMAAPTATRAMQLAITKKFKQNSLFLRGSASTLIQTTLMKQSDLDTDQLNRLLDMLLTAVSDQTLVSNCVEESHIKIAIEKLENGNGPSDTGVISSHILQMIPAFDVPKMQYNLDRKQFLESRHTPRLNPSEGTAKSDVFRDRQALLKQRIQRHHIFAKRVEGSTSSGKSLELSPLSSLLGKRRQKTSDGEDASTIIMGLVSQLEEGKYFIEDSDGCVRIKFDKDLLYTEGVFTEMAIIVAEGIYDDGIFMAKSFGFPPPEPRVESINAFGTLNFFGGEFLSTEQSAMKEIELEEQGLSFILLSDVWLDKPQVLDRLKQLFEGFSAIKPAPVFVLMGNFLSQTYGDKTPAMLKNRFNVLTDMILEHDELSKEATFLFIPGPKDVGSGVCNILPRRQLPAFCVSRVAQKLPKAMFGTNPTRLRYCTQEIVIFREDIVNKMRRNCFLAPKTEKADDMSISNHVVKTLVDQAHLIPLPLHVAPIYWEYDHTLRLYPVPDLLILGDKFDTYRHVYSGATAVNPGSFLTTDFSFVVYTPALLSTFHAHVGKEDEKEIFDKMLSYSKIE